VVLIFLFAEKDELQLFEESKNFRLIAKGAKYTYDCSSCYQDAVCAEWGDKDFAKGPWGAYSGYSEGKKKRFKNYYCLKDWLTELMHCRVGHSEDQQALSKALCHSYAYLATWSKCAGYKWGAP
jgi:hypothetical protein